MAESRDLKARIDEVRAAEAAYDAAWSTGDLAALGRMFAADCILVNPRGEALAGRDAVLAQVGPMLGGAHRSTIERVSFPHPDVAVVDGFVRDAGTQLRMPPHRFTDILVHGPDGWKISHIRADRAKASSDGLSHDYPM